MSDFEASRPRRAMAPDELVDEFVDDDTPAETTAARRYAVEDETDLENPAEPEVPAEKTANPFARPGSDSAAQPLETPIPRPVLPSTDLQSPEETTLGRRMGPVALGPTPAPRRSADSSLTPPEPETGFSPAQPPSAPSWFEHHRRTLLVWGIGALLLAVLLAAGIFLFRQFSDPVGSPSPSESPSPTETVSEVPEATVADLITEEDAQLIVADASWVVTNTATQRSEFPSRAVCLSSDASNVNPLIALQQTLGTSQEDQLAAMHQVEVFTTAEAAEALMEQRVASLPGCGGVPAHLVQTWGVDGLGDAAIGFTIAYENDPAEFHTLIMVRSGRRLSMLDVVRHGEQVPPDALAQAMLRSLEALCEPSEGTCPGEVTVSEQLPIPGDPVGWLEPWDLPRIRAGSGMWTANSPAQVSLQGTTCENLPLATEPGPSDRTQRTFIMTQDAQAHDAFGLDEIRFSFAEPEDADEFADRLINNIDGCAERLLSAEVSEIDVVEGTGDDDTAVSTKTYLIELEASDEDNITFQVAVGSSGDKVTYLLATVTPDYRFTDDQWNEVALRAAQRATQS